MVPQKRLVYIIHIARLQDSPEGATTAHSHRCRVRKEQLLAVHFAAGSSLTYPQSALTF